MIDVIQWGATITGIAAAILVALNWGARITGWGFVIFTVSSVCWVTFAVLEGELPLAIQNGVLFCINLLGIYRYWILKKEPGKVDATPERNDHPGVGAIGPGSAAT